MKNENIMLENKEDLDEFTCVNKYLPLNEFDRKQH
jgi:hypothetical protein